MSSEKIPVNRACFTSRLHAEPIPAFTIPQRSQPAFESFWPIDDHRHSGEHSTRGVGGGHARSPPLHVNFKPSADANSEKILGFIVVRPKAELVTSGSRSGRTEFFAKTSRRTTHSEEHFGAPHSFFSLPNCNEGQRPTTFKYPDA